MPTPEEITRHHEWQPADWVAERPDPAPLVIDAYDPSWPATYELVAERIRAALGPRVLALDHIGSTAVPGLAAKPVIDVDLTVADSAEEQAFVPDLEAAGFRLTAREPGWHEHRLLTGDDPRVHLHVFSPGCPETIRHRMFRDWLTAHPEDAFLYVRTKLESAAVTSATGGDMMDYNQRKQAVIHEIYARMFDAHGLL